jgi:hypothetical protein
MDSRELRAGEAMGSGEAADIAQSQELNDAACEPEARIEQTGDCRRSEAIQADFTAVVENTAAAASGNSDSVPKDEIRENIPPMMEGGGDRDTVLGREPQTAEGSFAEGGGEDAGGENITPINLPDIRNEGLPADGKLAPKADAGSGVKVDPVTGQVSGSIETGGAADPRTGISSTMQEKTQDPGIGRNTAQIGDVPPPRINLSEGKGEPSHQPIGPGISDEPPTMKQPDGGTLEGSQAPLGPQELADQRFAEQALDALGYGMIGYVSGAKGGDYGTGVLGLAGKTYGAGNHKMDGGTIGMSSSGGGAPVHHYGSSKGKGSAPSNIKKSSSPYLRCVQ